MAQKIRLTELDLHRIVKESVKKILKESGHLYGHSEDGKPFTNSKQTWRGVKGTTFISHGEWADSEIWYKGEEINSSELEDYLWDVYSEQCEEEGKKPTYGEYDNLPTEWFEEELENYFYM